MKKGNPYLSEKFAVEYTIYGKKNTGQKKWVRTNKNKNGSWTRWGVTRQGTRFKEVIKSNASEKDITKLFNEAKKNKDARSNNVSMRLQSYTGKFYGKNKKIDGERKFIQHYRIGKKSKIMKGKKIITYTTNVNDLLGQVMLINDSKQDE